MKKTIKRISMLLMVLILILTGSSAVSAEVINYKKYNGYTYTVDQHMAGVYIKNYIGKKKAIEIPEKIKGEKVTGINLGKKTKITSVVISKNVEFVRVSGAPLLTEVSVKTTNKKYKAVKNVITNKKGTILYSVAGGLKTVNVPEKVKKLYHLSFTEAKVEKVVLGKNFAKIGSYAFDDCKRLKKVVLNGNKAPRIYEDAFDDVDNKVTFVVKTKKIAKTLKGRLLENGPENFEIYVGKNFYTKHIDD